jgi:acyl-CoA synthetase (AMP-forming)/AMP-acid ligase II
MEILFGVPMLGAIAAPLDHWWSWEDAHIALDQIRPRVLIVGPAQAAALAGSHAAIEAVGIAHVLVIDHVVEGGSGFRSYQDLTAGALAIEQITPVSAGDPALILFTSGSTGRSKGAVHSHAGLVATARTMSVALDLHDAERTLHFLPLFSSCLEHLIPLTLVRATHVVMAQFDAAAAWEAIAAQEITHFDAVPTTLRRLLDVAPAETPKSLRLVSYASEPMPAPLIAALVERMPGVSFVQFYGMIEHLCLTVLSPADQLRKIGTVGRPMEGAQLYLMDPAGQVAAVGEPGEIVARSPSVFAGYWQDEAATAQIMRGEWMRTGDLGRFDEEGFLTLEGRVKEMIKTGGLTVIPNEVEGVLLRHPAVRDAAVVGIPDEQWGEAVHAFVTLSPGASLREADLKSFCEDRLVGYKRPKHIHIVPELPRTGIGKIARRAMRDRSFATST